MCLELGKKITADKGLEIDKTASDLIKAAMYVDDFLGGGTPEEVARLWLVQMEK